MKHPLFASNCHNGFNGFVINVVFGIQPDVISYQTYSRIKNITDIKTTREAYEEFLTNASHTNKRELPLPLISHVTLVDIKHLIYDNELHIEAKAKINTLPGITLHT